MKKLFFKSFLTFLLFASIYQSGYSKSYSGGVLDSCSASINQNGLIHLSALSVCNQYSAEISQMGFQSEKDAMGYFSRYSCNLVKFELDYNQARVYIMLQTSRVDNNWTVQQWNQYLQKKNNAFIK